MRPPAVSFAIEWRSAARTWITTVACALHVRMVQQKVPIRYKSETFPVEQCAVCIAEKRNKERLKLEGRIENSPIADGAPPSVRLKAS
jgi:hypothetical protein